MHELLAPSETLPVPPGEGPFRVRGAFYVQVLDHVRKRPGGVEEFLDELADPRLREFVHTRFGWMKWYDAFPGVPLQMALARLAGTDFETATIARAQAANQSLGPKIFRTIIGFGRPNLAFQMLPDVVGKYYDFARLRVERTTTEEALLSVGRIPRFLAGSFLCTVTGLIEGGFDLIRIPERTVRWEDVAPDEPLEGYETVRFHIHSRWKAS